MTGVNIKIRADSRQATAEMGKLSRSISNIDKQAKSVTSTFQKLAIGLTAAFAAGGVTRGIVRASDAMTNMGNRVNLVTRDMAKTNAVMKELFSIAARSRSDVGAAADTFSRFGLALKDQNKPLKELLVVTEAVQKAGVISGSSSESAKAAIVQLGQGLASGQLRGQELNSVLEQMPRLAQAIAEGMGIPFGKLRESAMAGLVTAEAVYDAIIKGAQDIDDEYLLLKATVGGLSTVFKNEFTRAISEMDKVLGISSDIKKGILLATNAVRSFGENIGTWALIVDTQLLLLSGRIRFFVEDTKTFLGDLFTGNIDGEQLANNLLGSLDRLKDKVVKKIADINASIRNFFKKPPKYDEFGDVLTVQPIDVSQGFIKGFDAAILAVTSFVTTIKDLFWGLWSAIVGNSLWTGIFDINHEHNGAAAIGNTGSWGKGLIAAKEYIESWVKTLKRVFSNLHKSITTTWKALVGYVNTLSFEDITMDSLSAGFDSAIEKMKDAWGNFRKFLTTKTVETPGGLEEVDTNLKIGLDTISLKWGETVENMKTRWDSFYAYLMTTQVNTPAGLQTVDSDFAITIDKISKEWNTTVENLETRWDSFYSYLTVKEINTPAGLQTVETKFGETLRRMRESYGTFSESLPPLENLALTKTIQTPGGEETVDTPLYANAKAAIKRARELLEDSPLVIGIELLGRNLYKNLGNIRDTIIEFFDGNKNIMAAAIAVGFSVALKAKLNEKFGKMLLRGGIITAVIAAAGSLGNEPRFVEAAKSVAQGLGEAIRKVLEGGEGDFVGSIGRGLITLAKELGKSFIDGLFPTSTIASFDPFGDAIEIKNPQFDEFGDEVRNTLLDNIAGVFVGLAAALLISPKIVMFMSKLALGMSMKIGRAFLGAKSVGFIRDGISVGLIRSGKLASRSKTFRTGFENIGISAGKAMRGGMLAANAATMGLIAQQMTAAFIPEDSLGGAGEALDGAAAGLVIGAQLGSVIPGVGTAIGAAVGAAVGLGFDISNNPELRAKIAEMGVAVKDFFVNGWESAKATIAEGFESIFHGLFPEWLKGLVGAGNENTRSEFGDAIGKVNSGEDPEGKALLAKVRNSSQAMVDALDPASRAFIEQIAKVDNNTAVLEKLEKAVGNTATAIQKSADGFSKMIEARLYVGANQDSTFRKQDFITRATGGAVNGPGTGTSDDIPAMLSNGEFVMQQSAVQKFGPGFMAKINAGIMPIGRSDGGLAGQIEQVREAREVALARGDNIGNLQASKLLTQLRKLTNASESQLAVLEDINASDEDKATVVGDLSKNKARAELAESYAEAFKNDFKASLSTLLKTGDFKGFVHGLLDSFTSKVIDSFVDGFTDSLFEGLTGKGGWLTKLFAGSNAFGDSIGEKTTSAVSSSIAKQDGAQGGIMSSITGFFGKMFEGIKGIFSGGAGAGGGNLLSGLLGSGGGGGIFSALTGGTFGAFLGFSQGGTVPNIPGSQAGKDSVPAMLMPGEVVLSKNQLSNMHANGGNGQSTQSFNINVQGDVSRQTRAEIVKMMPQIAGGVNAQNKENNYRR